MLRRLLALLAGLATCAVIAGIAQAKAPHDGWPPIDGMLWINKYDLNATFHGGVLNDELLGGHGDDHIYGHGGDDVIWGDYKASGNTAAQHDTILGGSGNDWIYGSHGRNRIWGGPGNDTIRVWFGRGFVDCGAGQDILYVSHKSGPHVKRRNCETVSHKSARDVAGG
jgi:RTX calcium-binding nonapeptide repeat (4 copies)